MLLLDGHTVYEFHCRWVRRWAAFEEVWEGVDDAVGGAFARVMGKAEDAGVLESHRVLSFDGSQLGVMLWDPVG